MTLNNILRVEVEMQERLHCEKLVHFVKTKIFDLIYLCLIGTEVAAGLKQLLDMGFTDELRLIALLRRFNGNVGEVVKYIFENTV